MPTEIPLSLYIHVPWCVQKCPYCDFNSHAVKNGLPEARYVDALLEDLQFDLERFKITRPVGQIFFGGGTPSLFSPESIDRVLSGIGQKIALKKNLEITLEANPGTFESGKFAEFRKAGINRLSIGIQSFNDGHLKRLGRVHSAKEAINAAEIAHHSGFENFNLDLMFGLPEGTPESSGSDIETAVGLQPTHISLYQLTLEPNTLFHKFPPTLPGEDEIFKEQKNGQKILADNDYQQYEISAYARSGYQCRHNLNYWEFGDYLGIGAGAHGKVSMSLPGRITRYWKEKSPEIYLKNAGIEQGARGNNVVAESELPLEFVMNHLRLKQGFSIEKYQSRTGLSVETIRPALMENMEQGLIILENNRYRCSEKGWDFLDAILARFMSA